MPRLAGRAVVGGRGAQHRQPHLRFCQQGALSYSCSVWLELVSLFEMFNIVTRPKSVVGWLQIDLGRDLERQLELYVDCRQACPNLDAVKHTLVTCAINVRACRAVCSAAARLLHASRAIPVLPHDCPSIAAGVEGAQVCEGPSHAQDADVCQVCAGVCR